MTAGWSAWSPSGATARYPSPSTRCSTERPCTTTWPADPAVSAEADPRRVDARGVNARRRGGARAWDDDGHDPGPHLLPHRGGVVVHPGVVHSPPGRRGRPPDQQAHHKHDREGDDHERDDRSCREPTRTVLAAARAAARPLIPLLRARRV